MSDSPDRRIWLPGAATALAALSCYGTTALIAVLSALGVSLALDERVWAGAISVFASIAAVTIAASYPRRRAIGPPIIAAIGLGLVLWAMYGSYSRLAELAGFACLATAAVWHWRIGRDQARTSERA
ncbi:MAG: MerC family mercury resistance protein [Hyphomicrobiaceae bacterium]|nr:MerC family mercury resistance protein [Hyphomicrobiaceae bacterium]